MAQTDYSTNNTEGFAGSWATSALRDSVSRIAKGSIYFGRAVQHAGDDGDNNGLLGLAVMAGKGGAAAVASADLVTSNSISGTITTTTADGTATVRPFGPVVYASSHLNTMGLLEAAIEALDGIESVTVGGANNRTLTVQAEDGVTLSAFSLTVTLGASQATFTVTYSLGDRPVLGVALHEHKELRTTGVDFAAEEVLAIATRGTVRVYSEQAVKPGDAVYVRHTDGGAGKAVGQFRKDSDSSTADQLASGFAWASTTSGAGIAHLRVNLPG